MKLGRILAMLFEVSGSWRHRELPIESRLGNFWLGLSERGREVLPLRHLQVALHMSSAQDFLLGGWCGVCAIRSGC